MYYISRLFLRYLILSEEEKRAPAGQRLFQEGVEQLKVVTMRLGG